MEPRRVSSLNFTAIAPALVGNAVIWKPSPAATFSDYLIYQTPTEAHVPLGVIQFVPGPPPEVIARAISHPRSDMQLLHSGGFEYQGHVLHSRGYMFHRSSVSKDLLLSEVAMIEVGPPSDFSNFMRPVIGRPAYHKIMGFIQEAKDAGGEVLIGGIGDDSKGYFIHTTYHHSNRRS